MNGWVVLHRDRVGMRRDVVEGMNGSRVSIEASDAGCETEMDDAT